MTRTAAAAIKVFWQPGRASCLRTKEFLAKHEVPFISVNVQEDGFQDLERFGLPQVPNATMNSPFSFNRASTLVAVFWEASSEV